MNQSLSDPIPPDVREGSRVLLETTNWVVGIPAAMHAMHWWGAFTEWCVALDHGMFNSYLAEGALIVFRSRKTSSRWALHTSTGEFRNDRNRRASWSGFLMRHPEIAGGLLHELARLNPPDPIPIKPLVEGLSALAELVRHHAYDKPMVAMHVGEMEGAAMRALDYAK